MSDVDDIAIRLENALSRIAAAAERRPAMEAAPAPQTAEVAARLDALILELRTTLAALDEE